MKELERKDVAEERRVSARRRLRHRVEIHGPAAERDQGDQPDERPGPPGALRAGQRDRRGRQAVHVYFFPSSFAAGGGSSPFSWRPVLKPRIASPSPLPSSGSFF